MCVSVSELKYLRIRELKKMLKKTKDRNKNPATKLEKGGKERVEKLEMNGTKIEILIIINEL